MGLLCRKFNGNSNGVERRLSKSWCCSSFDFFYVDVFKKVTKKHTLWALDKLVIAVALAGGFIRMGNLMNSEIVGLRTDQPVGLFSKTLLPNKWPLFLE